MDMPDLVLFTLLCVILTIAAVADFRTGRIPNVLTLGATAAGLAAHAVLGAMAGGWAGLGGQLGASALGMLAALIPFAAIYFSGGLGGGDVKLMAATGAIGASWMFVLSTAFYAVLLAALMAVVLMIRKQIVRQTMQRLLSAAMMAACRVKPDLPDDSPRVPFGVAIGFGGILAGLEHLLHVPFPWSM